MAVLAPLATVPGPVIATRAPRTLIAFARMSAMVLSNWGRCHCRSENSARMGSLPHS